MSYTMLHAMLKDTGISYKIFKDGVGIELTEEEMKGILDEFEDKEKRNFLVKKEDILKAAISKDCEITVGGEVYIISELTINNNCVTHIFGQSVLLGRCEVRAIFINKQKAKERAVSFLAVPGEEDYYRIFFRTI